MEDLKIGDILFIFSLPYILLGYAILCLLYAPYEWLRSNRSNSRVYATLASLALVTFGELDQRLRGHPFNVNQLLDLQLHHEHLIILCIAACSVLVIPSLWRMLKFTDPQLNHRRP